jgi:hypothetical protein
MMTQTGSLMNSECVEIYIPKTLENLAKLYAFLQQKLMERKNGVPQDVPVDGFSLYEVDGAFYGHEIYQERTIVIRILFNREHVGDNRSIEDNVRALGAEIAATVAMNEEELWVCHYPQGVVVFSPRNQG